MVPVIDVRIAPGRQGEQRCPQSTCGQPLEGARCGHCGVASRAGRWTIEKVLSQSAHSRVYLARDVEGRVCALKELHFALAPSTDDIDAFDREATMLAAIEHPAIPRFLERFQEGSGVGLRLYLATELIHGQSLAARLAGGPMPESEVLAVGEALLLVLVALQQRSPSVFHRDLKPANVMFRGDGSVVLVDFGSARLTEGSRTHRSTLVGTFGYMPPEQLGGTVDKSSDVFALGATLLHALTGRAPEELMRENLAHRLPSALSPPLRAWLERALAVDPRRRFRSAEEALTAWRAKEVPRSRRPSKGFMIALSVVLGAFGIVMAIAPSASELPAPAAAVAQDSWFSRVKSRCNQLEVRSLMASQPPPPGAEGAGMAAGCYALAGRFDDARTLLATLDRQSQATAAWQVFEIAHPVADQGEDLAAGPMMELVLEFWPDNFQALYHAGIAEYVAGDSEKARERLEEFRRVYAADDFFGQRADMVLGRIKKGLPPEPGVGLGGH